jgi:hypothetical protein
MNKLDKLIVSKQIKNIGYNDAINDFQNLKSMNTGHTFHLLAHAV